MLKILGVAKKASPFPKDIKSTTAISSYLRKIIGNTIKKPWSASVYSTC
jgi:hypothetical protein